MIPFDTFAGFLFWYAVVVHLVGFRYLINQTAESEFAYKTFKASLVWCALILIIAPDQTIFFITTLIVFFPVAIYFVFHTIRREFYGFRIIFPLGGFLNIVAVIANKWRMPVSSKLVTSLGWGSIDYGMNHMVSDSHTRFFPLIDWFYSRWWMGDVIFSVGDVCIILGIIISAAQLFMYEHRLRTKRIARP